MLSNAINDTDLMITWLEPAIHNVQRTVTVIHKPTGISVTETGLTRKLAKAKAVLRVKELVVAEKRK